MPRTALALANTTSYRAQADEYFIEKHENVPADDFGKVIQSLESIVANSRLGIAQQQQNRRDQLVQVQVSVLHGNKNRCANEISSMEAYHSTSFDPGKRTPIRPIAAEAKPTRPPLR